MQAVGLLQEMGYANVRHYPGGIGDWIEHGGPVEGSLGDGSAMGSPPARAPEGAPQQTPVPPENGRSWKLLDVLSSSSLGVLFGLWLGIVLGCGVLYWLLALGSAPSLAEGREPVPRTLAGLGTAIYFSFATATSVGYGDVRPLGPTRVLAVIESVAALLIFGCVISKLVSRRQELLIEEIHHITFEDRLGRVRTNLHMVLSELQGISAECDPATLSTGRILPRVESVAMVFTGELLTVHELLYRPQLVPEEAIFEAILANLAASLREFCDLLDRFPDARERSPLLRNGLVSIRGRAGEICGNCVPRQYAPGLRVWMDRIHDLAGRLAANGI
jgi:hypothetical protein